MLDITSIFLGVLTLFCSPDCGQFWSMFHMYLRIMCILLLKEELSWKYQLSPSGIMYYLNIYGLCFLVDLLSGCSVHWWKWGVNFYQYYCASVYLSFMAVSICLIFWDPIFVHMYLKLLHLLLGLTLWSLCSFFFVCHNSLYFKVYFVWYEYCYSSDFLFHFLGIIVSIPSLSVCTCS